MDEVCEDEVFQRTLAAKLWTKNIFNTRAFTNTMIPAWKLKNQVEAQELSKNLFLFCFSTKRDLEGVLRNDPWSFDRKLLVMARVSGEEQPSYLNMHFGTFWIRVYDLPLKMRLEAMTTKLGGILGDFKEMDLKEAHRNGIFLRLKVKINLKQLLKRGTLVRFKEKNLQFHFKYERLPTFIFICGRVGHQMKDCEAVGDLSEEGFKDLEEQDLSYGAWLRFSPLPRAQEEQKKKESTSSSCDKSLFNISSRQSRCDAKGKEKENDKEGEEGEVEKHKQKELTGDKGEVNKDNEGWHRGCVFEIKAMEDSLGAVDISNIGKATGKDVRESRKKRKKWTRNSGVRKGAKHRD